MFGGDYFQFDFGDKKKTKKKKEKKVKVAKEDEEIEGFERGTQYLYEDLLSRCGPWRGKILMRFFSSCVTR